MRPFKFRCPYCDKRYKNEKFFDAHTCKEMIRSEQASTIEGQRAFAYFQEWNKLRGRRILSLDQFIAAPTYNSFFVFDSFSRKVDLPNIKLYMKIMVEKDLQPSIWVNDIAYSYYIDYMDKRVGSNQQASITVDSIFDWCEVNDINSSDFFDYIPPNNLIKMILKRRLSPWILFNSKKFEIYYKNKLSSEQRKILDNIHSPSAWKNKFSKRQQEVTNMEKVVNEMQL